MCNDDRLGGGNLVHIFFIYYSEAEKWPRSFVRVSSSKGETGLAEKSQSEIFRHDLPQAQQYNWDGKFCAGGKKYVENTI